MVQKCEHLYLMVGQFVEKDTVRNSNKNLIKAWKYVHHLPFIHQANIPIIEDQIAKDFSLINPHWLAPE